MLSTVINHLLDDKLATVREIEEVTGRGTSTIYRWIKGKSQPSFTDIRNLVRHLGNPEARRAVVSLLTHDLPVVINWISEEPFTVEDDKGGQHDGMEVVGQSLLALECVSEVLNQQHEAIRKGELTKEAYASLVTMMDDAVLHLTASKNLLERYAPVRKKARSTK